MKIVPANFGMVEEQIYRCGCIQARNYPFLETLKLRTIVDLSAERPSAAFQQWIEDNSIVSVYPCSGQFTRGSSQYLTENLVLAVLKVLLDASCYPVLVTCETGRYRTGTVIGCLRKLQRWSLSSVVDEYRRYAGSKGRLDNEEFIELFDTDLMSFPDEGSRPSIMYAPVPAQGK
jgi:tyrosine-protein phosphatase OCA1